MLLVALGGCSSIFGLHDPTHATTADAPASTDVAADTPASMCLGAGSLMVCFDALPTTSTTLPAAIDTTQSPLCSTSAHWASQQTDSCFVTGTSVTESGTTRVTGSRPLVLVATGDLLITGTLDASSHIADRSTGAAADAASCTTGTLPMNGNTGGGGGAGGTFTTLGGAGGQGANAGPAGGIAGGIVAATSLHGGCPGQAGAPGGNIAAAPGHGGGAVYLLAGASLTLAGTIAANGSAGSSAQNRAGGGGGGSGGMIVLYATSITTNMTSKLIADGGGGASGADGAQGNDGSDPLLADVITPAPGGAAGFGGAGGNGYANGTAAQPGLDAPSGTSRGGGGGGGGAGYIRANVAITNARVSPPVDVVP